MHHGLQRQADDWPKRLRDQSRRWAARGLPVRFDWRRLEGGPARGDSVEAWARRGRYAALADMARAARCDLVLLAHHRRDQAETFVLQALRGAGPPGLAAMPRQVLRDGIVWARPWLDLPREAIEAYLKRHRLVYVDDASNADPRHVRNALRHVVWPALLDAFADAETALAASARRAAEAAECLWTLAAADLSAVAPTGAALSVAAWLELGPARRGNALRAWLARSAPRGVPETLVMRLLAELPASRNGSGWPTAAGALRLNRGELRFVAHGAAANERPRSRPPTCVDLSRPGRHRLPQWAGAIEVRRVLQGGVAAQRLRHCEARTRQGGERFQRAASTPPRSLKKQFQAAGVAAWERDVPLVYASGELVFVPGLGIDARRIAPPGTPQLALRWLPDDPGKP